MPPSSKTQHKVISNTALPYITNSSPISTDPSYVDGFDLLTSLRGFTEKRPGFADTIEQVASTFNNLKRIFVWQRWVASGSAAGSYFVMFNDVAGAQSRVYKLRLGYDASAVEIFSMPTSNQFFFVNANNCVYFGCGLDGSMKKYDGTTLNNWGIVAPAVAPTFTLGAGTLDAAAGYFYLQTYGYGVGTGADAESIGESSPGPLSLGTGVFTDMNVSVGLTASTDPQVNQIHVYRTTDGGSTDPAQMRELPDSPYPNATAVIVDSSIDDDLGIQTAPPELRNDPPLPAYPDCWYAGRIWTHLNNQVYYSGFEEIGRGVPEECFPGGLDGNYYPYDRQVTKVAELTNGVAVFTPKRMYGIDGDSLDTFRRYTLLDKRGTQSPSSVVAVGGSLAWLDTSGQVWLSDLGEISTAIRPNIQNINPLTAYITVHISGIFHWVVLLDGENGKLYVFDLDTKQWMPPWNIGKTGSCLTSAETSSTTVDLMLGRNGSKALKLNSLKYTDDGDLYAGQGITNQFNISPEQTPDWRGVLDWVEWKRNQFPINGFSQLTDDDPESASFFDLTPRIIPAPTVKQGKYILTERAPSNVQTCQLASIKFDWSKGTDNFKLYSIDVASHPSGG